MNISNKTREISGITKTKFSARCLRCVSFTSAWAPHSLINWISNRTITSKSKPCLKEKWSIFSWQYFLVNNPIQENRKKKIEEVNSAKTSPVPRRRRSIRFSGRIYYYFEIINDIVLFYWLYILLRYQILGKPTVNQFLLILHWFFCFQKIWIVYFRRKMLKIFTESF